MERSFTDTGARRRHGEQVQRTWERPHLLLAVSERRLLLPAARGTLPGMARVAVLLLTVALSGCAGQGTTSSPDQPRRFADYEDVSTPAAGQCHLPVEERTGGWFCYEAG